MAISEAYLRALEEQKKLIAQLGSSSPIPGLTVEQVARNLAALDQNLKATIQYYESQAEIESSAEAGSGTDAGPSGPTETPEQRRERRRREAAKKVEDVVNSYIESQRDFIQEQISIIEVNFGIIEDEVTQIPKTLGLATTTSLQPAALGAAAPNPAFNLGLLYQIISSIRRSLENIRSSFLNVLIAADKIKFALPAEVTGLLQKILSLQEILKGRTPSEKDINVPVPNAPVGTEVILNPGEFGTVSGTEGYVVVTSESVFQVRKGQIGQIVENLPNGKVRIRIVESTSGSSTGGSGEDLQQI